MKSLGLWNLMIICLVVIVLRSCWKRDGETEFLTNSVFLQHPFNQKLIRFFRHPLVNLPLQVILALIVTRLIAFNGWTAYMLTQPNAPFWDFKWFYVASHLIHQDISPYQPNTFSDYYCKLTAVCGVIPPFIYPPNILPLLWPIGYFSITSASTIWVALHLLTIVSLLWGANILLDSRAKRFIIICTLICAVNYGISFDLRVGNISSVVTALLLWSVILAKKGRNNLSGILLGISAVKPTLSILFFLYFMLKRRFSLILWGVATLLLLTGIGFLITGDSVLEFYKLYKAGVEWTFSELHSNIPSISPSRIDLEVIAYRLFPDNKVLAKVLSGLIRGGLTLLVFFHLYKRQVSNSWSKDIDLAEVGLIACLSIAVNYSQEHGAAMLVFAAVFLLKYLLGEIQDNQFNFPKMSLWVSAILCLFIHSCFLSLLEPLQSAWIQGELSYLFIITVGSLPNYTILWLIFSILILTANWRARTM